MMQRWGRAARSCARRGVTLAAMAATIAVLLAPVAAEADTFRWNNQDGNWNDPAQWTRTEGGSARTFPNAPGDIAEFAVGVVTVHSVTIPAGMTVTVGALKFDRLSDVQILGGNDSSTLILDNGPAASTDVTVVGGATGLLNVRMVLEGALLVNVSGDALVFFENRIDEAGSAETVTKTGPGEMIMLATIGYTGTTTVAEGLLTLFFIPSPGLAGDLVIGDEIGAPRSAAVRLESNDQLSDAGQVLIKADGLLDFSNTVDRIGALTVTDGVVEASGFFASRLTMQSLSMTGGLLRHIDRSVAFEIEGPVTATASATGPARVRATSNAGTLNLLGGTRTFTVHDGPGDVDLDLDIAIVGTGSAGLIKEGAGTLRFSGTGVNTYPGDTLVRQGRLELAHAGTVAVPGGLRIGHGTTAAEVVLLTNHNIADTVNVSVGEAGFLLSAREQVDVIGGLEVGTGGRVILGHAAAGKLSASSLAMTGGEITFREGSVLVLRGDVVATSSPIQTAVLTGDGVIDLGGGDRAFVVSDGQRLIDLRVDVQIAGANPDDLIKRGAGVALFRGINSYTGQTRVEEGTLLVTGTHTTSPITLAGGSLGGTGIVGRIDASRGTVAPGPGPGRLTAAQVTFAAAATFAVEVNGTTAGTDYDLLDVSGSVTLGNAALAMTVAAGFVPSADASFTILANGGTDAVTGTFAGLAEGAKVTIGGKELTISYRGGDGNDVVLTVKSDTDEPTPTDLTYYLAEGATGTFFDEDVLIANPNDTAAPVTLTFLQEGGGTVVEQRTVPALARLTIHVDRIAGLADTSASVRVVSTDRLPLIVERSMFWDDTYYGGHTANAVAKPETRWIFAEGSQGFFDTYILIANANDTATMATLTFLRENGAPVVKTVPVGPFARKTVWAGDYPEVVNGSFGVVVEATQPVIAERAMYFATLPGKQWTGGHVNTGIIAPSTSWFHAEGATGTYFNTFILLSNPQDTAAQVEVRFLLDTGDVITRRKTIAARQRLTINPATEGDPRLENAALSTVVQSDVPIVSERSMYWPGAATPLGEGHNSAGVVSTALRWGLAEGRVGGERKFDTYILLANPSTSAAEATITYLRESGAPIVKTYTVPATSRYNVDVKAVVPELLDSSFGARIEVTNNVPIAVERSLYWNANGVLWEGGTNALATPIP